MLSNNQMINIKFFVFLAILKLAFKIKGFTMENILKLSL